MKPPVIAMFDHHYPNPVRKQDREISLLCSRSGYKIIKADLDKLESDGKIIFERWKQSN